MRFDHDLVIVGGGPGTLPAIAEARKRGLDVCIVDGSAPEEGNQVAVGSLPRKHVLEAPRGGFELDPAKSIFDNVGSMLHYDVGDAYGVPVLTGYGQFADDHAIEIVTGEHEGTIVTGRRILLKTGSTPRAPWIDGIDDVAVRDSRTIQHGATPSAVIVIGSSIDSVEWSAILQDRGADVTLLVPDDSLLPQLPARLGSVAADLLAAQGVTVRTDAAIERIEETADGPVVTLADEQVRASDVLLLTGTNPHSGRLRLHNTEVEADEKGFIRVDESYRTSSSPVYAVGDVADSPGRTDLAAVREGALAVRNAFDGTRQTVNYDALPHVVFTQPELFSVGRPADAFENEQDVITETVTLADAPQVTTLRRNSDGEITITVDADTGELLGVYGFGPAVDSIASVAASAIQFGLTASDVAENAYPYPKSSGALAWAASRVAA